MNTDKLRFSSNRVCDIATRFHIELDPLYGKAEVATFLEMLAEEYLGWDRTHLLLNRQSTINQSDLLRLHWALEDLLQHRPIQHIIGHVDFLGVRLAVDSRALVPRPETEQLVQLVLDRRSTVRRAMDLCTGSGCIGIALAHHRPTARVQALDVSPDALDLAADNARACNTKVELFQADLLGCDSWGATSFGKGQFDLIVSNPPYVLWSEAAQMRPNVLTYDPHMALFVPDSDPLCFYRAIANFASRRLAKGGLVAMEINETLANETAALFSQSGFVTETIEDFRGKPRFVLAR